MVDAPIDKGGATEAYFLGEPLTSKVIMLNLNYYNRNYLDFYNPHRTDKSKPMRGVPFKLFLADVEQESIDRQYLIDAHEVAFCVPNIIDSNEMLLGFIHSNELGEKKFYFYSRNTGSRIVATTDNVTLQFNSAMAAVAENSLSFNAILKKAGAILDNVTAENCDINLDPAEVTKDVLIGLLAKK